MKRFLAVILAILLPLLTFPAFVLAFPPPAGGFLNPFDRSKRLIVTFKEGISDVDQERVISDRAGDRIKRLRLVNSQVVNLRSSRIESLRDDPRVLRVEEDVQAFALCHRWWQNCASPSPSPSPSPDPSPSPSPDASPSSSPSPSPSPSTQPIPWGVDRIDAELAWSASTADTVKVAIIDTGIDLDHLDLAANVKGGVNTIRSDRSADDDNGHGSHVAGIVAAINNAYGVVGVGPDVDLYAVKVLNRRGSGYLSDVIEGIEWSVNNNVDVINMSLGTTSDIEAFHDAVIAAKNAGITIVAAAGNSGPGNNTVIYPAKYPEAIAVSATNSSDGQPSWSSRGPQVDVAAPGNSIYSTYEDGEYRTLSGTSMASPHIAGAAALVLATHPGFTPSQVQAHLESTAEFLAGLSSNQQGSGLVDVEKAVNN